MSLRVVHLLFIIACVLFTSGVAAWVFATGLAPLWLGAANAVLAVALAAYGVYFVGKSKKLH